MNEVKTVKMDDQRLSQAVIDVVATAEGAPPAELTPPLYDVVDPEALDKLFAGKTTLGKVVFNYNSYEVLVDADGYVVVKDHSG